MLPWCEDGNVLCCPLFVRWSIWLILNFFLYLATQHAHQNFKSYQGTQKVTRAYGPWCSYATDCVTFLNWMGTTCEPIMCKLGNGNGNPTPEQNATPEILHCK